MKTFKFLMRIMTIVSFLSISAFAVVLDTDTFEVNLESWTGTNLSRTGGGNKVMYIPDRDTASKLFVFPAYANQGVSLTLTATKSNFELTDTMVITFNGQTVYNSYAVGTITLNGWLNSSGELDVKITSNTNDSAEFLTIDDVALSTGFTYTASNERDFTQQYTKNTIGDIALIGNTVLCKSSVQTSSYKTGVCAAPLSGDSNDAIYTLYHKLALDTNASIFNSSSSDLTIPAGSTVLWATLYWQGGINSDTIDTTTGDATLTNMTTAMDKAQKVLFKTPNTNGSYITITSATGKFNWKNNAANYNYYQGAADVTQYVKQSGTYQLANLIANDGNSNGGTGPYGGWSLMVVYEDLTSGTSKLKNMIVYDGYKLVNSDITKTLSGFLTPLSGVVDSKFTMFAAEADSTRTDTISMTNSAGTFVTVASNELASSIVGSDGLAVTTRTPSYGNTIGTDIHTWNVGTTAGAKNIIGNNQTTTDVKFTYGTDIYNLGLFAFSTNLYEPDVCYVENIFKGTTNISGIGAQVNKDDNLTVRVYIKNKGTEAASGVSVLHQFDSSFPYAVNSANYNNSNPAYETVMPPVTYARATASDSVGNDLYEYNTTSLIAKINLGTGATSSSGGTFTPNTTTAVFEYNATVKILDSNYSNVYKAGYINSVLGVDYTNNPITIYSCDGSKNSFYGYSAPLSVTGDFNVVYHSNINPSLSSGYNYNLPTQIASRADNYDIIALDSGTDILKDVNKTKVAVQLIDASTGSCATATPLSDVKTWIYVTGNQATFNASDIVNGVVLNDPNAAQKFYKNAGKNVKFRVSYPTDGSGGLIVMEETVPGKFHLQNFPSYAGDTCVYPVTATTYNPANGNIQGEATYTQVPQACGNAGTSGASAMTQHEVNVCLECIYGTSVNYTCSKDNFAIRPEAFYVKLSDQNQTNFVTKQAMANNISGAVALNLASGYKYYAEVNATNHIDNNATSGYTTAEGIDSLWAPTGISSGCNDDTNKTTAVNFINGLVDTNLSVDQVGEYTLNITDNTWTDVDSNISTMTHHTSPFFLSGTDCTVNSAATSSSLGFYNGCNISTNHINDNAGITYVDMGVTYKPYDFNLTSVQMSRGQNFAGSIMGQNTWTYMNNLNVNENMSVRYFGPIKAEGKTGTLLSNFVNNCYAQPINFELNLTFPASANLQNWRYRLQEVNASNQIWNDTNTSFLSPISSPTFNLLTVPASSFLKTQNGLIDVNLSVNFDRNQTTPVNPITVGLNNFQVKCNSTVDCSSRADFSNSHLPDTNVTTDNNTTFVYGRLISRDVRVFGSVPFTANGWYEVFNAPSLVATNLPASKNDASWYTNTLHLQPSDGDAAVTVITVGSLPSTTTYTNGIVNYNFDAINALAIPYSAKAHIDTDPWLWYGTNALSYLDPANPGNLECATHPCFNINVVPAVGATGSAKAGAETKKSSKKSTSEVGASGWKSTSDYAPAIR